MSDPTARRGDNITQLLNEIRASNKGWTWQQMKSKLFSLYRFGVREQTLDTILRQLKEHNYIYGKPKPKAKNIVLWYAVPEDI